MRTVVVPVVLEAAKGVKEGGDLGLVGSLVRVSLMVQLGLIGPTGPLGRTGLFIVLSIGGKAGVVSPIDRTVGWAMVLRLVGN